MQSRVDGDVLLVGSLPFETAEENLSHAGTLGREASQIPDGEIGDRKKWTGALPLNVYSKHPDLVETNRPETHIPNPEDEGLRAQSMRYHWTFRVKPGVTALEFPTLGYADAAKASYPTFVRLREEGTIAPGTRFQVAFPSTASGTDMFFDDPEQWPLIHGAYARAVGREVREILEVVPAEDLAIQFDLAWEVNDLSVGDTTYLPWWPEKTYAEKFAFYTDLAVALTAQVPEDVVLGFHWCYGTWGGWPMTDMDDVQLCVDLSNGTVKRAARHIDYVHIPVIVDPGPGFFAPLEELDIGDTKVFLGLVHHVDGIEGSRRRIAQAKPHLAHFGVAAVCGYGRENPAELGGIFDLNGASAEAVRAA